MTIVLLCNLWLPGAAFGPTAAFAETSADPDGEIVYIDNTGVIRVLDTLQTSGNPKVDWLSPTGGWSDFALGDVNNDGDKEIVAIKSVNNVGTLAVFDPVVTSGTFDEKTPNGIPWAKLYETTVQGNMKLVATGKLDPNLPGDHITYLYELNSDMQRQVVLKPSTPTPTGRDWTTHYTRDFDEQWEQISVGNVDNSGADEIALVDDSLGRISVYRADSQSDTILKKTGDSRPWRATTIAQFDGGGGKEVIGIRDGDLLDSFFVFRYKSSDSFDEIVTEQFSPAPRYAFAGDINNDGKQEIIMLRSVSTSNAIRMIVRGDDPGDIPTELEQRLDSDNGYQVGAAGDVDGDGRAEIVIMRDNNIRVYTQPDRNASFDNYGTQTNVRSVAIGDLDKNGFVIGPQFSTSISAIEETLQIGSSGSAKFIEITNSTSNTPISYNVEIENNPSWLEVTPRFGNTPAVLTYRVNAIGLGTGEYKTRIKITSSNSNVVNQPYYIQVTLTATPALLEPQPTHISFSYVASQQPVTLTQNISVFGTDGVRFTAAVASIPAIQAANAVLSGGIRTGYLAENGQIVVQDDLGNETILEADSLEAADATDWLSVTPAEGTVPAILSLTVHSSKQTSDFAQAYVVLIGDSRTGIPPQNVRLMTVSALRANQQLFMPTIRK